MKPQPAMCVNGEIISSNISSQEIHNKFGGVIPELASREHEKVLNLIIHEDTSGCKLSTK